MSYQEFVSSSSLLLGALLSAFTLLLVQPVAAETPLFVFVQASDSQPVTAQDQLRFDDAFTAISEAGDAGALLPYPIDFVVFPGDLVDRDDSTPQWLQFIDVLTTHLTLNDIPFFASPGNHDQQIGGLENYRAYIGNPELWDFGSAWFTGQNGRSGATGWHGLRFVGINNSNGSPNAIAAADLAALADIVADAEAKGENLFVVAHYPHNATDQIPLASALESLSVAGYLRGHTGSPFAQQGLAGLTNPNVWEVNSNSILDKGVIVYYEVFQTYINVYVLQLAFNPTVLPAPLTIALAQPLTPAVPDSPVAAFSAAPVAGSAPLSTAFYDESSGPATAWHWDFGDGTASTLKNPAHTYFAAGSYSVTLTASNSSGSNITTASNLVTVAPAPPIRGFSAVADAQVNSTQAGRNYGADARLRIRAGSPEYRTFLRFDVTGIGANQINGASLRLAVTDGSNSGGSVHVVSSAWDEATISFSNAPTISGPAIASAVGADGADGAIEAGELVSYDVSAAITGDGTYSFALITQSSNSAMFDSREGAAPPELVIQVGDPVPPSVSFLADPVSGTAPLSVNFSDTSRFAPDSWAWEFGDGATSASPDPVHVYATPGSYSVALSAANVAGSGSLIRTALIQVLPPVQPAAEFTVDVISGPAPLTVAFTDQSNGNPTAWAWDFGDTASAGEPNPIHTYSNAGEYTVALTVTNAAGTDTRTQPGLIVVGAAPPIVRFEPRDDALVRSSRPSRNYGSLDNIRVRDAASGYESFMQFEVVGLQGRSVLSAMLKLLVIDGSSSGGTLIATDAGWRESTLTFDSAPAPTDSFSHEIGAVAAGETVEIDVTSEIAGEGLYSFGLVGGEANSALYSSKEGLMAPVLELVLDEFLVEPPSPASLTFIASADARVRSDRLSTNYGTDPVLRVRDALDISHLSFLKFDVAGVGSAPVSSVKLRLYVTDASRDGGSLYVTDSDWNETEITFGNAPAIEGTAIGQAGEVVTDRWVEFDLLPYLTPMGVTNRTYSFALMSSSSNSALYSSREGAEPPQLRIEFE